MVRRVELVIAINSSPMKIIHRYGGKHLKSFFFLLVFYERMGCFHVKIERILIHQVSSSEIIKTCSTVAWSLGLIYFAVHNGSECFGEKRLQSLLPRLNASSGCFGGRGGPNVSDVYRLTSKTAFFRLRGINDVFIFLITLSTIHQSVRLSMLSCSQFLFNHSLSSFCVLLCICFNMSSKITEFSYNLTEICRELRKKNEKTTEKLPFLTQVFVMT